MAKKGKKKKGKGKKKGKKKGAGNASSNPEQEKPELQADPDDYVNIHVKLAHWSFMDFQLLLPTYTKLFVIKRKLVQKFGPMKNLKMYRSDQSFNMREQNLLTDEMSTLEENGFKGKPFDPKKAIVVEPETEEKKEEGEEEEEEEPSHSRSPSEEKEITLADVPTYVVMFDYTPDDADAPLLLVENAVQKEVKEIVSKTGTASLRNSPKNSPIPTRKEIQ
eukprot:g524.t1